MKNYNILFFSSGRSDFELIKPILLKLKKYKNFKTNLIITGSHLSKKHGNTFKSIDPQIANHIEKIDIKCDLINNNNFNKQFIYAQKKFEKIFIKKSFDLSIILGDRYEALAFGLCCFFKRIKIAHIHGGEITNGAIDDTIRHLLTKLSDIHYVSNLEHKNRVIQMGEHPKSVKNVGLLGLENINSMKFLDKKNIFNRLKINRKKKNILVSYHPVTRLSKKENKNQFNQLLNALKKFYNFNIIFTCPNIDPGNQDIAIQIKKFLLKNDNSYFFYSLGQRKFFSLAKSSEVFIGNSSSGILEIPFLNIPVINIGTRQEGRYNFAKIYHVDANSKIITRKLKKILNRKVKIRDNIKSIKKNTSSLIINHIINYLKKSNLNKKKFYDLKKN